MEEDYFELEPEHAHPNAQKLLVEEFYWDVTEAAAPFGSDDGHDAFYGFKEWRKHHPAEKPFEYVQHLMKQWWGKNSEHDWKSDLEKTVGDEYEYANYSFLSRDSALIAVCFGQLVLEGEIDVELKKLTLLALERQTHPMVQEFYSAEYHIRRKEILDKMTEDLKKME